MNLSGITIHAAFAEGLNLRKALFENARFDDGDFSAADFSGATFRNTTFHKTILTRANFEGATFVNCNLDRVNLVGASFHVEKITETIVYGIAAWDLKIGEETKQSKLVVDESQELYSDLIGRGEIPTMVDDIELAQFVFYLSKYKRMRNALNILNDRAVLLLGRFQDGGLERLYRVRERFRDRGYMPMIFDFARPQNLSLTETGVAMAALAKFLVAELSGPSVPAELADILNSFKKPVIAFGKDYSLFRDLADKIGNERLITVRGDESDLFKALKKCLSKVEKLHAERIIELTRRYAKAE
jgi:uncharacterized protein YjbI with pentapeptide repeats